MLSLKRRRFLASVPLIALGARAATAQTMFRFGTAAEGGSFMVYALAFLDAMRTVDPSLEIRRVSTEGTAENVPKLEAGDLDIAMVAGEVAHELFEGVDQPPTKLKIVSAMYSTPGMFAVRSDSRYRSIGDLKGRPVVWNVKGSGIAVQAKYMMGGLGLDIEKDFQPVYTDSRTKGPGLVLDGRAVALWGGGLRWPGFVEMADNPDGARFIVPSAEEIKTIRAKYDFLRPIKVPAGLYRGQYDALTTVGAWSYLLARDGLDDEIGYRLASDLAKIERGGLVSRQLEESTARNTIASLPRPGSAGLGLLQSGVLRFYKEKGLLP
jgi:TRAP transporter TAXI family solute receptor